MGKILVKLGDKGSIVTAIQKKIGSKTTGVYDSATKKAVESYQEANGLSVDGVCGEKTLASLGIENPEEHSSTDVSKLSQNTIDSQQTLGSAVMAGKMQKLMLDKDEYFQEKTEKLWLFIHHTAGGHNPQDTVKNWNNDTRGRIATQYVIGGKSTRGFDGFDGVVVDCMVDGGWAYHLGNNGNSDLHPKSIAIEVCNYGWLTKDKNGNFTNYVGGIIPNDMVCDLGFKFNGYQYYHAYTDAQIESLRLLILDIAKRYPSINIKKGLQEYLLKESPAEAFGYKEEVFKGKVVGLFTHTNVRKDKTDMSPQPKLVEMLKGL